ncbi:MAG: ketoacyl-ACP synthase III [Proteobacteria bacterium]|nr:MAG: ketoacyl-ACP synthase III [Pseudomonadota bacterium]
MQRHIADESELTSDMAYYAAFYALEKSGLSREDIDLIIVATTTPDRTFPSVATIVQNRLGIKGGAAFDVQAVCTGFIYAIDIANNYIKANKANNIIVVGAESMSKIIDWRDRSTCILFGDGAGAVILSKTQENTGIISSDIESDGSYGSLLYTDGGVCINKSSGVIVMNGTELMKLATEKMSESILSITEKNNFIIDDIKYIIPHQANIRIISAIERKTQIPSNKVIITVDKHANTSAASIPIALCEAWEQGRVKEGDLICVAAFGSGFTWGSALLYW